MTDKRKEKQQKKETATTVVNKGEAASAGTNSDQKSKQKATNKEEKNTNWTLIGTIWSHFRYLVIKLYLFRTLVQNFVWEELEPYLSRRSLLLSFDSTSNFLRWRTKRWGGEVWIWIWYDDGVCRIRKRRWRRRRRRCLLLLFLLDSFSLRLSFFFSSTNLFAPSFSSCVSSSRFFRWSVRLDQRLSEGDRGSDL